MASESKKDDATKADGKEGRRDSADRVGHTRAIGALLPGIAGETLGRRGFAEGTIFRQWREIVGPDIAAEAPFRASDEQPASARSSVLNPAETAGFRPLLELSLPVD